MTREQKKALELGLAGLCTIVILVLVFTKIDRARLLAALVSADSVTVLLAALGATFMNTVQSAEAFRRALALVGAPISYRSALGATVGSLAISAALPAGSGQLGRVAWVHRRHGVPAARALAGALALLWLKLCALLGIGLLGALLAQSPLPEQLAAGAALLACLALLRAAPWIARWAPGATELGRALAEPRERRATDILSAAGHAALSVFAEIVIFAFLVRSLGHAVPFSALLARFPLVVIGSKLPVTLMGIGTREALCVWLFAPWAPAEVLLGASLLFSAVEQVLPAALGSALTFPFLRGILQGRSDKKR